MERHEDPVRVRDAVRRAAWQGAGRLLGAQAVLLLVAAVLYPAFATIKVGPKLNADSIANAIRNVRQETGRWPAGFEEVRARIRFDDRLGPHRVSFVQLADRGGEAEYAVAFDRTLQTFRIDAERGYQKLEGPVSGTLPK